MKDYRADLRDIFTAAVEYADPERLVREAVMDNPDFEYTPEKIYMFAFGKAACGMARGFLSVCQVDKGIVVSNESPVCQFPENIEVIKAGHPLPNEGSVVAAEKMLSLASQADEETLCVFLVSGGGSAILCSPAFGISLDEKMKTFDILIKSGADIEEINTVRRHISSIKGGRLAEMASPAKSVTLAISDVLSGARNAIASGATYYDETTWSDAIEVIERYQLKDKLPKKVIDVLISGENGKFPDTVKGQDSDYNFHNIGTNMGGIQAAGEKAYEMGYRTKIYGQLESDAVDAAEEMASQIGENLMTYSDNKPICMVFGGEVTVNVRGEGKGGRCQQLAIEYLLIDKPAETYALCASTDGMDGNTDAAGAYVDELVDKDDAEVFALNNNAYEFFAKNDALMKTGLTGTNINDVYIILIPSSELEGQLQALASKSSCI